MPGRCRTRIARVVGGHAVGELAGAVGRPIVDDEERRRGQVLRGSPRRCRAGSRPRRTSAGRPRCRRRGRSAASSRPSVRAVVAGAIPGAIPGAMRLRHPWSAPVGRAAAAGRHASNRCRTRRPSRRRPWNRWRPMTVRAGDLVPRVAVTPHGPADDLDARPGGELRQDLAREGRRRAHPQAVDDDSAEPAGGERALRRAIRRVHERRRADRGEPGGERCAELGPRPVEAERPDAGAAQPGLG